MNAASCRASTVRRGRSALFVSERTVLTLPRLPSYVERASKCVRVLSSRLVEIARACTHARTLAIYARSGFIHKVTRFARKRLRARVNDRNRRLRPLFLTYIPSREDVNTRLRNERSAPTSGWLGCTASEDAPPVGNKSRAVNAPLSCLSLFLSTALYKPWDGLRDSASSYCHSTAIDSRHQNLNLS